MVSASTRWSRKQKVMKPYVLWSVHPTLVSFSLSLTPSQPCLSSHLPHSAPCHAVTAPRCCTSYPRQTPAHSLCTGLPSSKASLPPKPLHPGSVTAQAPTNPHDHIGPREGYVFRDGVSTHHLPAFFLTLWYTICCSANSFFNRCWSHCAGSFNTHTVPPPPCHVPPDEMRILARRALPPVLR